MDHIGMDVHTKESQICTLAEGEFDTDKDERVAGGIQDDLLPPDQQNCLSDRSV